jgi:predicted RNA-binding Zn ribbon-like protein
VQSTTPTGQWFRATDGREWWFDSGALSLDFAYTGAMGDNPEWETLHSVDNLATWLEHRFPAVTATVGDRDLADALALRAVIARMAMAASRDEAPAADDVDTVNLFAATPDIPPALAGGSRQAGRSKARTGQALSAMAREAVELFAAEQRERIRLCADPTCGLVFYDESRSNNRRWCSMKRCGNRAKVRTHRANAR